MTAIARTKRFYMQISCVRIWKNEYVNSGFEIHLILLLYWKWIRGICSIYFSRIQFNNCNRFGWMGKSMVWRLIDSRTPQSSGRHSPYCKQTRLRRNKKKTNSVPRFVTPLFCSCDCLPMSCHCSRRTTYILRSSLLGLTFRMHLFVMCWLHTAKWNIFIYFAFNHH